MKHVEAIELLSAVPVPMTREQKLMRWADLVRRHPGPLHLFHGLEFMTAREMHDYRHHAGGPFALAVAQSDPEFRAQGLRADASIAEALQFFDLTQQQAHAFSCDCGGSISNDDQARRIENLAYRR